MRIGQSQLVQATWTNGFIADCMRLQIRRADAYGRDCPRFQLHPRQRLRNVLGRYDAMPVKIMSEDG